MNKLIKNLVIFFGLLLLMPTIVLAASLSVKIEQPKSPTNLNNFKINFVTLDTEGRSITAKCFKKGPTDAVFTQLGSDISITAGGNSGNCEVTSGVLSSEGTYSFYVTVMAGADTSDSPVVSVEYKNSYPGTPKNYNKEKIGDCTYRIKFRTDNDGGRTTKVELYRSTETNFSVDGSTKTDSLNIGPDQDGQFENTVPDCSKSYYFAIRAFDSAGNGSGTAGDESISVVNVTVNPTGTSGAQGSGAIPVSRSSVGSASGDKSGSGEVLGKETKEGSSEGKADISPSPSKPSEGVLSASFFSSKKNLALIGSLLGLALLIYYSKKSKKA